MDQRQVQLVQPRVPLVRPQMDRQLVRLVQQLVPLVRHRTDRQELEQLVQQRVRVLVRRQMDRQPCGWVRQALVRRQMDRRALEQARQVPLAQVHHQTDRQVELVQVQPVLLVQARHPNGSAG